MDRSRPADDLVARALVFLLQDADGTGRLARDLVESGLALTVRAGLAGDQAAGLLFVRTAASTAGTPAVLAKTRETFDALARGTADAGGVQAFLARERAEQRAGDPARCAERRLLGHPGCGEPPVEIRVEDVAEGARRLFSHGAPLALVLGPAESSAR